METKTGHICEACSPHIVQLAACAEHAPAPLPGDFRCEGGRGVSRDGQPFAYVQRSVTPRTEAGPDPCDVDRFAYIAAAGPRLLAALRVVCAVGANAAQLAAGDSDDRGEWAADWDEAIKEASAAVFEATRWERL